ncbi:MAG: hypothetical protein WC967_04425 [Balneolaceae bacterium]
MKKPNINFKKVTGVIGIILFSFSMLIAQVPKEAFADGTELEESCVIGCNGSAQLCQSHGSSCKVKVKL